MRQETAGVTEALLESAKKEFLKYGFHDANLRRISADSAAVRWKPSNILSTTPMSMPHSRTDW